MSVDVEDPPVCSLLVKLAGHDLLHGEHDAVLAPDGDGSAAVLRSLPRVVDLEDLAIRRDVVNL